MSIDVMVISERQMEKLILAGALRKVKELKNEVEALASLVELEQICNEELCKKLKIAEANEKVNRMFLKSIGYDLMTGGSRERTIEFIQKFLEVGNGV